MIIEEKLGENAKRHAAELASTLNNFQMVLLRKLIEKQKLKEIDAHGEIPLEKLIKTLDKRRGETLNHCALSSDVYQELQATGLLERSGISCYSALASQTSDQILLFYGSFDQKYMDQVLNVMDAYYGTKSELTKDEFFLAMKDKEIAIFKGFSDEDLMLLSDLTKDAGEDGTFSRALPYTVVEMDGEKYLLCNAEDLKLMNDNIDLVAAIYTSEQGERVLKDIREQIKGKQERNITVDEAKKYSMIIDRNAPKNKILVTAHDFEYYKNNKELTKIPLHDKLQLNRVYDLIDGMSDPVLVKDARQFEHLSLAEQMEYMNNSATSIQRESDIPVNVNLTQAREQLKDADAITNYLSKVSAIVVASSSAKDLNHLVKQYEQAYRDQTQEPDKHTRDYDAR